MFCGSHLDPQLLQCLLMSSFPPWPLSVMALMTVSPGTQHSARRHVGGMRSSSASHSPPSCGTVGAQGALASTRTFSLSGNHGTRAQRSTEWAKGHHCDVWTSGGAATGTQGQKRAIFRHGGPATTKMYVVLLIHVFASSHTHRVVGPRRGDEADPDLTSQARRKWSQYQFFTQCIENRIANGGTALQAIHELDGLCGSQMLSQLHCKLQPKGRRGKKDSLLGTGTAMATVTAAGFAGSPNDEPSTGPGAGPLLARVVPHGNGNDGVLLSAASG